MNIFLHQTDIIIGDFTSRRKYIESILLREPKEEELHLLPELFLIGYPLQDLCLQKPFYGQYLKLVKELNQFSKSLKSNPKIKILIGGLDYMFKESETPSTIQNKIFGFSPGEQLESLYCKQLLPNYDIFDEKKYFKPGNTSGVVQYFGLNIGMLICEDMWPSESHNIDPSALLRDYLKEKNLKLDLLINLSASPFIIDKCNARIARGKYLSESFNCPFAYVNQACSEDEIIFDGGSFYVENKQEHVAKYFEAEVKEIKYSKMGPATTPTYVTPNSHVWEDLFSPKLDFSGKFPSIPVWNDSQLETFFKAIKFGLQQYAQKSGFSKFLIALSGGIDSALVLALTKHSLMPGQSLQAVYMPGPYSSDLSYECAVEQCDNLNIELKVLPINSLFTLAASEAKLALGHEFAGITLENLQSRLRGALIYGQSNQTGAMVINTSNKSELAVGYSTQYGDSVGAISLLGDLYKSEVFQMAAF